MKSDNNSESRRPSSQKLTIVPPHSINGRLRYEIDTVSSNTGTGRWRSQTRTADMVQFRDKAVDFDAG
jgi:hypothetical protein